MEEVRCINLTKIYNMGKGSVRALRGVDLTVPQGAFYAVMGTSGCGKSTLLNMIGGLDRPSSGTVEINGKDLSQMKERELAVLRRDYIGFVFQRFNLIDELTVGENIILPILLSGKKPDEDKINDLCETLQIKDRIDTDFTFVSSRGFRPVISIISRAQR